MVLMNVTTTKAQYHILHSIALQQPDVRLKFLIYSRAESYLTLKFTSLTSPGMATRLSLDAGYERNADIKQYLTHSFHQIARTHPLKAYIASTWPTSDVIFTLVGKSSGQFILLSSTYLLSSQVHTRILGDALRLRERRV